MGRDVLGGPSEWPTSKWRQPLENLAISLTLIELSIVKRKKKDTGCFAWIVI